MNILQDIIAQSEERKRRIREEAAEERRRQESDVPPPKKAKVTMSVLCVENGVLGGGPKRGRSPKSMYMTEFVACFFRGVWKLRHLRNGMPMT